MWKVLHKYGKFYERAKICSTPLANNLFGLSMHFSHKLGPNNVKITGLKRCHTDMQNRFCIGCVSFLAFSQLCLFAALHVRGYVIPF